MGAQLIIMCKGNRHMSLSAAIRANSKRLKLISSGMHPLLSLLYSPSTLPLPFLIYVCFICIMNVTTIFRLILMARACYDPSKAPRMLSLPLLFLFLFLLLFLFYFIYILLFIFTLSCVEEDRCLAENLCRGRKEGCELL